LYSTFLFTVCFFVSKENISIQSLKTREIPGLHQKNILKNFEEFFKSVFVIKTGLGYIFYKKL